MPDQTDNIKQLVDGTKQLAKRGRNVYEDDSSTSAQSEIKGLLLALSAKMDTINETMCGNDVRLNAKIDNLEVAMSNKIQVAKDDMEKRIQTLSTNVDTRLENAVLDSQSKCYENTSKVAVRVDELQAYHESRLDRLERLSLDKDLIISGVPLENDDNPFAIVGDICGALNCNLKQGDFISVFRLGNRGANSKNKRTLPIVARVHDEWCKNELLATYFKKKNLNLTDIGFKTPARIFINERLTASNREIFNRAAEAKKSNLIHRFFTRRGLVFVQRDENSNPMCIPHFSDLDVVFPLNRDGNRSRYVPNTRSAQNKPPASQSKSKPEASVQINPAQPNADVHRGTPDSMDTQQISSDQRAGDHDDNHQSK